MTARHYLDWNATAPLRPEAQAAMLDALALTGNPSSVHTAGRAARAVVDRARAQVASLVGALPAGVVFTSGGTEADTLALSGTGRRRTLISAVEHEAVRRAAPSDTHVIPVDAMGVVRLDALEALLADGAGAQTLVSVMAANNETGVLQPVAEIAALTRAAGALFHCDAVQWVGRLPFALEATGYDLVTVSAHKLGGPQGVGALILRPGLGLTPLLPGGGQESRRRGGTENVAGIAGFGAAAEAARAGLDGDHARMMALRDRLEQGLRAAVPGAVIIGAGVPRLPNTVQVAVAGARAETLIMALDLAGYAVSAGAACSSGKVETSAVLAAMGVDPALAAGAIRVSFGGTTEAAALDGFVAAYAAGVGRALKGRAA